MIRRTSAVIVGTFVAFASQITVAQAEIVESPAGAVSTAQVSIAIDNDWQFQAAECLLIPVLATYGRADSTSIIGELTVTKPGDPSIANEGTFLVLPGDAVSGRVLDEIFVCPADGTGEYRVSTLIRAVDPDGEQVFDLDPLTFWVRPAESLMSNVSAVGIKGGMRVSGVVRAGRGYATGIVEVRVRRPGESRWKLAGRLPLDTGSFNGVVNESMPPGTRVRATLTDCSWCSRVAAVTRVR